jgi:hypothetical protein
MTAGYSGTPLDRKLGIESGMRVIVIDEPAGWLAGHVHMPAGVQVRDLRTRSAAMILLFARDRASFEKRLVQASDRLPADGMLWVAWPKRASGIVTDITEDVVREVTHPYGLVDVKVAALDETWSGLKLVVRRERRGEW